MCGIFAVINDRKNQAAQTTLEGLKLLEYRGYDSWGIAVVDENGVVAIEKHVGKIGEAKISLPKGSIAIGHTRWATHGGVTDENAHPHLDCRRRFVVIHNGIVENYQELKNELVKKKHQFKSETDTEIIAHLIEEQIKIAPLEKAVLTVFKKLVGSNAIGVLDSAAQTIVACRNGSPLVVGLAQNQFFLASDVTAFLKNTNKVLFLADGEAVVLTAREVKLYDINSEKEKELNLMQIDWKAEDAQKGGYPHFLLKEIMEQKLRIPKAALLNREAMEKIVKKKLKKIVLVGCGTAYYCALAAKYFFAEAGVEVVAYPAYEFLPFGQFLNSKTIMFAISQSGETG